MCVCTRRVTSVWMLQTIRTGPPNPLPPTTHHPPLLFTRRVCRRCEQLKGRTRFRRRFVVCSSSEPPVNRLPLMWPRGDGCYENISGMSEHAHVVFVRVCACTRMHLQFIPAEACPRSFRLCCLLDLLVDLDESPSSWPHRFHHP